jgi:hypothetical protein
VGKERKYLKRVRVEGGFENDQTQEATNQRPRCWLQSSQLLLPGTDTSGKENEREEELGES